MLAFIMLTRFELQMVETKGLDLADREKAKYEAHRQASEAVAQDF